MKIKIALIACLAMSGCGKVEPSMSVEWYKDRASERAAMIAECKASPGERQLTANCQNAQAAQNQLDNGRTGIAPLTPLQKSGGG